MIAIEITIDGLEGEKQLSGPFIAGLCKSFLAPGIEVNLTSVVQDWGYPKGWRGQAVLLLAVPVGDDPIAKYIADNG